MGRFQSVVARANKKLTLQLAAAATGWVNAYFEYARAVP